MPPERPAEPCHAPVSRRAFLAGGATALGGLVLATELRSAAGAASAQDLAPLNLSADLYASPEPQRLVMALARGGSGGIRFASGPAAKFRFQAPNSSAGTQSPPTGWIRASLDRAGLPKGRGVYVTMPVFDQPGVWKAEVSAAGERVPFSLRVNPRASAPIIGQAAPRAASPTTTEALGTNPICTRRPACPLHAVSLTNVIGAGKPVAALFATPARCQSQYCGPVLDELLAVRKHYEDRVTFVHIEIYQADTGTAYVPTVTAWGLPSEPWLFGIDAAGTVRSRIDGAFGGDEMKALLDSLV